MRLRRKKKNFYFVIVLFILMIIGVGYSYLNSTLNIEGVANVAKGTWDIHLDNISIKDGSITAEEAATVLPDTTAVSFSINLSDRGEYYEFDVDVVNNGSMDAMLSEITTSGVSDSQSAYIDYLVTYTDGNEIKKNDVLPRKTTDTIKVKVQYKEDISSTTLPNEDQNLKLQLQLTYVQYDKSSGNNANTIYKMMSKVAKLDGLPSEYVSGWIDFSKISSNTNGIGVYTVNSTKNDTHPIHYYRGNIDNNNLVYANFCWKIVRTTDTGGIKLLYNGPYTNGSCSQTADTSIIGKINFNPSGNNAYVGYMYGNTGGTTYEEVYKNTNSSKIKRLIDNWYEAYFLDYAAKIEDTVWCNDRSISSGTGIGDDYTIYGAPARFSASEVKPSLTCNANDRFTVNENHGNGNLTYPIGLLTADEVLYAGCIVDGNADTYISNGGKWYTMTPYQGSMRSWIQYIHIYYVSSASLTTISGDISAGVRPSISLIANTKTRRGDGTEENPYIAF